MTSRLARRRETDIGACVSAWQKIQTDGIFSHCRQSFRAVFPRDATFAPVQDGHHVFDAGAADIHTLDAPQNTRPWRVKVILQSPSSPGQTLMKLPSTNGTTPSMAPCESGFPSSRLAIGTKPPMDNVRSGAPSTTSQISHDWISASTLACVRNALSVRSR